MQPNTTQCAPGSNGLIGDLMLRVLVLLYKLNCAATSRVPGLYREVLPRCILTHGWFRLCFRLGYIRMIMYTQQGWQWQAVCLQHRCVIPLMLCNKLESNGAKSDNNGAWLKIKITHPWCPGLQGISFMLLLAHELMIIQQRNKAEKCGNMWNSGVKLVSLPVN